MDTIYKVGDKVRVLKDIWDDGDESHHPPGYLAMAGEILVVRFLGKTSIGISHENRTDNYFWVERDEIEKE